MQLYSLSISARATLNMHSLNNEGGEGNQIQTRMVNIIDQNGQLQNVNAISGDMFKHIQAEHFFRLAKDNPELSLCEGCQQFNANRINADSDFLSLLGQTETVAVKGKKKKQPKYNDAQMMDFLIRKCAMDDIEGILITSKGKADEQDQETDDGEESGGAKKRSLPRKSIIEFGWVIGVPGQVETDSYFHVKYGASDRNKSSGTREEEEESGSNLGQAIFHRPASSGIYAAVCHLELARIGFNDITQEYAIEEDQRRARAQALLQSVLYTFMEPKGAMRASQAPHIVEVSGVVSISTSPVPAPTISPLKDDYRDQIDGIGRSLEKIAPGAVQLAPFDTLAELTDIVGDLLQDSTPYTLSYQ